MSPWMSRLPRASQAARVQTSAWKGSSQPSDAMPAAAGLSEAEASDVGFESWVDIERFDLCAAVPGGVFSPAL
ncbi:hypothetical protein OKW31_008108 [Paraburkholderia atlantica]